MMYEKCTLGYLTKRKKAEILWIVFFVVFTSTEKIMHLDFLLVKNGNVLGVIAKSKQDVPYLKQYLTDVVKKTAPSYHVRLFESDEKLISHLQRLTQEEASENSEKTLVDYLHSLAM